MVIDKWERSWVASALLKKCNNSIMLSFNCKQPFRTIFDNAMRKVIKKEFFNFICYINNRLVFLFIINKGGEGGCHGIGMMECT